MFPQRLPGKAGVFYARRTGSFPEQRSQNAGRKCYCDTRHNRLMKGKSGTNELMQENIFKHILITRL